MSGRAMLSKSAVLQNAMDFIDEIRQQNKQLRLENKRLRQILDQMGKLQ